MLICPLLSIHQSLCVHSLSSSILFGVVVAAALLKSAIHAQDERIRVARALLDEERAEKDAALAEERRAKEEVAAIEMAQQKLMYEVAANVRRTLHSHYARSM